MAKPLTPPGGGRGGKTTTDALNDTFTFSSADLSIPSYTIKAADLLANDVGAKGGTLSIVSAVGQDGATVQILQNGDLQVFAANPLNADAAFTYTIGDGKGGSDTATVTVNYTQPNHVPVAVDDFRDVTSEANVIVTYYTLISRLLGNDSDPDGDALSIIGIGKVIGGTAEFGLTDDDNFPAILYTPYDSLFPEGSAEYIVSDGKGGTDIGVITFS